MGFYSDRPFNGGNRVDSDSLGDNNYQVIQEFHRFEGDLIRLGISVTRSFENLRGGSNVDTVFYASGTNDIVAIVEDTVVYNSSFDFY